MKKTISTFALCLTVAALTACSSARGESAGTTSLEVTDKPAECTAAQEAECSAAKTECCTEAEAVKAEQACCEEGDAGDS
jgi:hypothetical protein